MALARVLRLCDRASPLPDDEAVLDYCDNVIQGFLDDGNIDGETATSDSLYEALQPFIDPDFEIGQENFLRAVEEISGAGGPTQSTDRLKEPDSDHSSNIGSNLVAHPAGSTSLSRQSREATQAAASSPQSAGPARNEPSSDSMLEGVLCVQHSSLQSLVAQVLQLATPCVPIDPTVVDYICNLLRNALEEKDVRDLQEVLVGVAPELQQLFRPAGSFEGFLARVAEVCGDDCKQEQQRDSCSTTAGRRHSAHEEAPDIQFTLRTNLPSSSSDDDDEEEEVVEEECIDSPRRAQLREIFPERPLVDLRTALDLSGGKVEEAIEKMFAIQEFEAMSISSDKVTAQQKADLQAFREATRERALTHYDKVKAEEVEEKGKGTVVKPLLSKDEAIDKAMVQLRAGGKKKNEVRYLDNQVVAHKGEKFLYTKTKNAAPEDPKTFIGLKVISKKKGGPSPNFK